MKETEPGPGPRARGEQAEATPARARFSFLPDGATRLLGIVGDPLDHSLSPALHTAVLRGLDRNLIYLPFPVSAERLPGFIRLLPGLGILGLNVTTPYKELTAGLVTAADEETARTGVVNTVFLRGEEVLGCGTDGAGVGEYLSGRGLFDEPVGLLGFGATGRSVAFSALTAGPGVAVIRTRQPSRALGALQSWGFAGTTRTGQAGGPIRIEHGRGPIRIEHAGEPPSGPVPRVWISTLPPGADLPFEGFWSALPPDAFLLDMNYGEGRTALARAAREREVDCADGIGPLCHQAALSLSIWLGIPAASGLYLKAAKALTADCVSHPGGA